jgi:hypothetical protein
MYDPGLLLACPYWKLETEKWRDGQEGLQGGKQVNIKNVVLTLSPQETLRLTRILFDEEKDEALAFLKECLKPQLDEATRDH